jgi:hypothetical protein
MLLGDLSAQSVLRRLLSGVSERDIQSIAVKAALRVLKSLEINIGILVGELEE